MTVSEIPDDRLDDAFGALSHELRLVVLEVLDREYGVETFGSDPLSYTELADRIESYAPEEFEFDASNFTYHLDVLDGVGFISREADGYRITQSGVRIVRAIRAGTITSEATFETVPIEEPCPYCDGRSVITIRDEWLFITCRDCPGAFAQEEHLPEGTIAGFEISPAAVDHRSPRELFRMAFRVGLQVHRLFAAGICPSCNATTTTERLDLCADHDPNEESICPSCERTTEEFVAVSCDVCNRSLMTFPAIIVATDPTVIAMLYERGHDVTDQTWTALSSPPDWPSKYASTDPTVIEYTIPVSDGDPLRVRLDEDLTVTVRER